MSSNRVRNAFMAAGMLGAGAAAGFAGGGLSSPSTISSMSEAGSPAFTQANIQDTVDQSMAFQVGYVEGIYLRNGIQGATTEGEHHDVREEIFERAIQMRGRGNQDVIDGLNQSRDIAFLESSEAVYSIGDLTALGKSAIEAHNELTLSGLDLKDTLMPLGLDNAERFGAQLLRDNLLEGDKSSRMEAIRDLPGSISSRRQVAQLDSRIDGYYGAHLEKFLELQSKGFPELVKRADLKDISTPVAPEGATRTTPGTGMTSTKLAAIQTIAKEKTSIKSAATSLRRTGEDQR